MNDHAIVWFRSDLRLDDNPAWNEATRRHEMSHHCSSSTRARSAVPVRSDEPPSSRDYPISMLSYSIMADDYASFQVGRSPY